MTMKKILKEWKRFTEAKKPKQHPFDRVLKAPDGFFKALDFAFSEPTFLGSDWRRKIDENPEYKAKVESAMQEDPKAKRKAASGFSYSVLEILGQDALEEVFSMKIKEFKEYYPEYAMWLKENMDLVFEEGTDSRMARPEVKYKRPVAFAGQFGDWWIFNDGKVWFKNKLQAEL